VKSAGLVRSLPLAASIGDWAWTSTATRRRRDANAKGDWQVVSDGALEALGERLLAGRALSASDSERSQPVVLVNETLARTYFAGREAIGGRIRMGSDKRALDDRRRIVATSATTASPRRSRRSSTSRTRSSRCRRVGRPAG
jgi:hypothetical protein